MEDTYQAVLNIDGDALNALYGVFDGHGGKRASAFAAQRLFDVVEASGKLFSDPSRALVEGYLNVRPLLYCSKRVYRGKTPRFLRRNCRVEPVL